MNLNTIFILCLGRQGQQQRLGLLTSFFSSWIKTIHHSFCCWMLNKAQFARIFLFPPSLVSSRSQTYPLLLVLLNGLGTKPALRLVPTMIKTFLKKTQKSFWVFFEPMCFFFLQFSDVSSGW